MLGDLIGGTLGHFAGMSFSINLPTGMAFATNSLGTTTLVTTGTTAITITGEQILCVAGLVYMSILSSGGIE